MINEEDNEWMNEPMGDYREDVDGLQKKVREQAEQIAELIKDNEAKNAKILDARRIIADMTAERDQQAEQIEELKRELSRIRIIEDNAVRLNAEYANEIDRLKRLLGDCANAISEVYEQYPTDKEWPERLGYSAKDFKRIVAKCDDACGIIERTGQWRLELEK